MRFRLLIINIYISIFLGCSIAQQNEKDVLVVQENDSLLQVEYENFSLDTLVQSLNKQNSCSFCGYTLSNDGKWFYVIRNKKLIIYSVENKNIRIEKKLTELFSRDKIDNLSCFNIIKSRDKMAIISFSNGTMYDTTIVKKVYFIEFDSLCVNYRSREMYFPKRSMLLYEDFLFKNYYLTKDETNTVLAGKYNTVLYFLNDTAQLNNRHEQVYDVYSNNTFEIKMGNSDKIKYKKIYLDNKLVFSFEPFYIKGTEINEISIYRNILSFRDTSYQYFFDLINKNLTKSPVIKMDINNRFDYGFYQIQNNQLRIAKVK